VEQRHQQQTQQLQQKHQQEQQHLQQRQQPTSIAGREAAAVTARFWLGSDWDVILRGYPQTLFTCLFYPISCTGYTNSCITMGSSLAPSVDDMH
jgi:hypothetical protein